VSSTPSCCTCPASQNLDGQTDALNAAGCQKIFADTASGKLTERPELTLCMGYLRAGDTLVVWRLDRLGRSLRHLVETVSARPMPRLAPVTRTALSAMLTMMTISFSSQAVARAGDAGVVRLGQVFCEGRYGRMPAGRHPEVHTLVESSAPVGSEAAGGSGPSWRARVTASVRLAAPSLSSRWLTCFSPCRG